MTPAPSDSERAREALDRLADTVGAPVLRGLTRVVLLVERAVAFVTRQP